MKSRILAAIAVLMSAVSLYAATVTFWWDAPAQPGTAFYKVYYSTRDDWQTTPNWTLVRNVTNPPVGPFTNALSGQVTTKFKFVFSNAPDTMVAGKVSVVDTNGTEVGAAIERRFPVSGLILTE